MFMCRILLLLTLFITVQCTTDSLRIRKTVSLDSHSDRQLKKYLIENGQPCSRQNCEQTEKQKSAPSSCPLGQGLRGNECADCDCDGEQHNCTFETGTVYGYSRTCICATGFGAQFSGRCKACDCGGPMFNCSFRFVWNSKTCTCGSSHQEIKGKCEDLTGTESSTTYRKTSTKSQTTYKSTTRKGKSTTGRTSKTKRTTTKKVRSTTPDRKKKSTTKIRQKSTTSAFTTKPPTTMPTTDVNSKQSTRTSSRSEIVSTGISTNNPTNPYTSSRVHETTTNIETNDTNTTTTYTLPTLNSTTMTIHDRSSSYSVIFTPASTTEFENNDTITASTTIPTTTMINLRTNPYTTNSGPTSPTSIKTDDMPVLTNVMSSSVTQTSDWPSSYTASSSPVSNTHIKTDNISIVTNSISSSMAQTNGTSISYTASSNPASNTHIKTNDISIVTNAISSSMTQTNGTSISYTATSNPASNTHIKTNDMSIVTNSISSSMAQTNSTSISYTASSNPASNTHIKTDDISIVTNSISSSMAQTNGTSISSTATSNPASNTHIKTNDISIVTNSISSSMAQTNGTSISYTASSNPASNTHNKTNGISIVTNTISSSNAQITGTSSSYTDSSNSASDTDIEIDDTPAVSNAMSSTVAQTNGRSCSYTDSSNPASNTIIKTNSTSTVTNAMRSSIIQTNDASDSYTTSSNHASNTDIKIDDTSTITNAINSTVTQTNYRSSFYTARSNPSSNTDVKTADTTTVTNATNSLVTQTNDRFSFYTASTSPSSTIDIKTDDTSTTTNSTTTNSLITTINDRSNSGTTGSYSTSITGKITNDTLKTTSNTISSTTIFFNNRSSIFTSTSYSISADTDITSEGSTTTHERTTSSTSSVFSNQSSTDSSTSNSISSTEYLYSKDNQSTPEATDQLSSSTSVSSIQTEVPDHCTPNPCKNNGNCTLLAAGYHCECDQLFTGKNCSEDIWCSKGEGKSLCKSSQCKFDRIQEYGYCKCPSDQYFDYSKSECITIDNCPLFPEKCKRSNEICKINECECRENYKRNNDECVPNYCARSTKCSGNEECSEDLENEGNVRCACSDGFFFNGSKCVGIDVCVYPGLNKCQQYCNSSSQACYCEPGFTLSKDVKHCDPLKPEFACKLNCGPGACVSKNGKQYCICPQTHVALNKTCIDRCTAKQLTPGVCPGMKCQPDDRKGFSCICDNYKNMSGLTVCERQYKCRQNANIKSCEKLNAICREEPEVPSGFECTCQNGLERDDNDGICKAKCDVKKYREKCLKLNAICDVNSDNKATCKCRPTFTFGSDGKCSEFARFSYIGVLPIFKQNYLSPSKMKYSEAMINDLYLQQNVFLDIDKIKRHIREAVFTLYQTAMTTEVLNCVESPSTVNCTIEIQFKLNPGKQVNLITTTSVCLSEKKNTNSCLMPPHLVLNAEVKRAPFQETDPCDDNIVRKNCGEGASCTRAKDGSKNFVCSCMSGFSMLSEEYPLTHSKTVIRRCSVFSKLDGRTPPEVIVAAVMGCVLLSAILLVAFKFRFRRLQGMKNDDEMLVTDGRMKYEMMETPRRNEFNGASSIRGFENRLYGKEVSLKT